MAWRRISWRACKGGAHLCLSFVNFSLFCLALLLGGMIASIHFVGSVPIPGFLESILREHFSRSGIELNWTSAEFDLIGRIRLRGLLCTEVGTGHPVLEADYVRIDLDLSGSLGRKPSTPEYIFLRDAYVFLPPELSADGGETASLRIDEFNGRFRWNQLQLTRLLAQTGNVRLSARGIVPLEGWSTDAEIEGETRRFPDLWRDLAERVAATLETLRSLPALSADFEFSVDGENHWLATVRGIAPEVEGRGVRARGLLLEIPDIDLRTRSLTHPARLWTSEIQGAAEQLPVLRQASVFLRGAPLRHPSGWRLPGTLWIYAAPRQDGFPDAAVKLTVPLHDLPNSLQGGGRLSFGTSWLNVAFALGMEVYDGRVDLQWRGDPDILLDGPLLAGGAVGAQTAFSTHTRLDAELSLGPGWSFERGTLRLQAFHSSVREATFDEAFTTAWLTPEALQVGPIRAFDADGQHAEGYFLQDFTTKNYRIVAQGTVFPRRLDSLLPKFYRKLWEDIDPGPHPAVADVDVISRWRSPQATHARVFVRGQQLGYLGIPVDRLTLHLFQATGFVDIATLDIASPRGPLKGSVGITFPPKAAPETPTLRLLDLDAQVPLADLGVVFGPEIAKLEDDLAFSAPPSIGIRGAVTVFPDKTTRKDLKVSVESLAPWSLRGVLFDRLSADLHLDGPLITFQPLVAGVADGRWELIGSVTDPAREGLDLDLTTVMRDVPYATLRDVLRAFRKTDANEETGEREKSAEDVPGLVDLELLLHCAGDPWTTLAGTGEVRVHDADLGRIHLFGGLSRAFSSAGLNLTSFKLDQFTSALEFEPGRLVLPDLVVRGPSLRLDTPGSLTLPETALDFRTKVFFLNTENPTLRGVLGGLLSPLGHVFELRIRGTLDDPKWNLVNSPLNLFRPREETKPAAPGETPLPAAQTPEEAPPEAAPEPRES